MGFDKLSTPPSLHSPDTLLTRAISAASGHDTVIALPPEDHPYHLARKALLQPQDRVILVAGAEKGLSETLKALATEARAGDYDGLIVLLADLPFVTRAHLEKLTEFFETFEGARIVRAMDETERGGHPVIFPASVLPDFAALSGDDGARMVIEHYGVKQVAMPSGAATWDVDTPDDWRKL
ncbi:hypothetical protein P73_2578 [Celeribacter indicus]|uniref:MobA-like NTP transferase domain-containing protein n=2 Tax=Celeribacter indicus TaxID=1208324 RepID=A0A0B5DV60_9RHOB|nr:hypothetical protein P73_2578 [Celeribacter indicus]